MAEGGDPAQAMVEGCIDCATGVWYIINIFEEGEQTRCRADSEVSQVLEDAYQKRRKCAVFQDKHTKSTISANMETNLLYVEGIPLAHAHIERVVEKRKEPLKEKKETMSTVVDGSQSRQTFSIIKDAAENDGAMTRLIDESLGPGSLKFNSVIKDQEVMLSAEIARMEDLFERIQIEAHNLEGSLDNLERQLGGEGGQQYFAKSTEGNQRSVLNRELKDIEDHVTNLLKDVKALSEGGYFYTYQVLNRVLSLMRKAGHIRTVVDNNTTLKPPPRQSANKVLMTAQCQQSSDGGKKVETSSALQHVEFCFQLIMKKHALLEEAFYGNDINTVKQALDQHEMDHEEIISFKTEVDKCMTYRENLNLVQEKQYQLLISQVQMMYPILCKTSCRRREYLLSLQDFLQNMNVELRWMSEKQEFIYDYSRRLDELSIPDEPIYKTLMQEITSRKAQIQAVHDKGYTMILEQHPASETVEMCLSTAESEWEWLKQLLNCLDKHMHDVHAYHQFFQEVQSCEQWINQQAEIVNNCMKQEKIPFKELEEMKKGCQNLQNALAECEKKVAVYAKTSHDIIPLKQRNHQVTTPVKVNSWCFVKRPNMTQHLHLHEECILLDNSQKIQWLVSNSRGEEVTVPSICVIIPPPNIEAKALVDRMKTSLESLKILVKTYGRKLTENRLVLIINFIKSCDFGQFQTKGPARFNVLLRELNEEAAKMIDEAGQADEKIQLRKDLDECNRKIQEFSKKFCEEVFPCQWDKFEVRFETEDHLLSMGYTIKKVSPIQMQYIADNRDEKDSLLERLKSKNLNGMLESGLLRIYLQEEKMKEDYLSEVKNNVITTLRSHIETHPAIQTKQLTQVVIENAQQAQELGHLECLRSNRVKIYICNSGNGVSVVGREVWKDVESICRAYGETSKNDAVCSISQSVGLNTENAAESLKQFEKESTESETRVTLDTSTIQLLTDSDFAGELCKKIPKVSVILLSSEVIFKGPHEALHKAKLYIECHLKSKGYWHEVEQAASLIETSKRLNFEAYLKGKIPDVHVLFSDGKIIIIGKENPFQACEGELAKFQSAINRDCIELRSIFLSYLKLQDVQNYIWEKFESGHIECYWQVIQNGIAFFYRNVEHFYAAKSTLMDSTKAQQLSFKSVIDLQEFENRPDVKNLIHENKGRLYKEELHADVLIYVGMPEVIDQIKELHGRHKADRKNHSHGHSSEVLLSPILLAYVKKYLMENIRKKFDVSVLELSDLSGIKITGAEEHVNNAVPEVKKIIDQKQVFIDSLEISKMSKTIARQIKEHVARIEAENMTCVEIVSIPIKGKDTLTVSVGKALDVCLVYGSTPESVVMQMIPVNDSLYPVCLAATDIMKKGVDLQKKAARALRKYVDANGKKPNAFKFIPDDDGSSGQHIVFFVMPDFSISMVDFQKQFQVGLLTVFDHAYTTNVTSLSLPIEMDEKLSVRQMFTVIMETLNIFLGKVEQPKNMKEIFLCSAEKGNQSILKQLLESMKPGEASSGEIITENYFGYDEEEDDSQVKIAVVTGSLLDQNLNVDVIVNSTTTKLALQTGSLSKAILDVAGNSIQDECIQKYPDGIKHGEVAVTSAGKLHSKRIFHGALKKVGKKNFHLQSLRSLMKNCLQKVKEEKCHSIAFPALGVGQLQYPVEDVAKEMFQSVINHADKYGVKLVKFVLPESDINIYNAFKEMEKTKNSLIQSSTDCNPEYEVSLEGCGLKIAIVVAKKYTMPCDVDIVFGSPAVDELTEKHSVKYGDYREKIITVKRDTKHWSETLFLCLRKDSSLKEELTSAVHYVQHMKFTSLSVYMSQIMDAAVCKPMIEDVIVALDACKSNVCDLERVMIVINDAMLQSLTPWFDANVKASQKSKTFINTISEYLGFKVPVIWKKFHTPCTQTSRTYVRIAGDASLSSSKICDTIQKKLKELETNGEQSMARSSDSQSSNSSTGSFDMVEDMQSEDTESTAPKEEEIRKVEEASFLTPEGTSVPGAEQLEMNSEDKEVPKVYLNFRTEVTKAVLNIIEDKLGSKGVDALISALRQVANVDTSNGKIMVFCDFKQAEEVQKCVFTHYQKATKNKHSGKDSMERHLIEGGNNDIKDLLEFAYGNTDWSKKLEVEGDKLYVFGTLSMKEKAKEAVQTITQWYHEEFFLTENEKQKADEAICLVRSEFPEIFIKQNSNNDKIMLNVANEDHFGKAKHKIKVALGRVKITSRGRKSRSLFPEGESSLSLPQNDRQESSLMSLPSVYQTSQSRAVIASKTYYTREGIEVKVYIGDIVRLPVDCIVNAANKNLSHGGGVALAIAKAAGREFDQESEEYVRKHGIIPVTQCCVTSAGRLPYKYVIHVVGPQWHDYKHNEKDKCGDDLKKTIVNCLIKAMGLKIKSIVIPSISSGIFGVPKDVCAQMYVQGVAEFSRTYSLQSDCVKEIHFVDMLPEMCHLTQVAFDNVFNTRSSNAALDNINLQEDSLASSTQRYPKVEVKTQNEASATIKPPSYAEVTSKDQGSKKNPYIIKPWDHTSILIYKHDITDVVVDAVVCPVSPNVEGGGVKSYSVKRECETYVTSPSKANLPLDIYIYSSWWTKPEEPGKTFEKLIKTSVQNIFNEVKKYQIASVALPILGTGDKTTIKLICEYMMNGISDVCADPKMLPVGQITIHLVTNETSVANQLKEIACQQFGQKCQVKGETLQAADRSVLFSKQHSLQVTVKNANATSVTQRESCSSHSHSNKRDYDNKKATCPICLETPVNPRACTGCGHVLCKECMEHTVKNKPVCPVCGKIYGIIIGNQPEGTMDVTTYSSSLPGFKFYGTIDILYSFPGGIQTEEHPNPGKPYHGTSRRAYLPDNTEGRKVLSLLKKAFNRRLVFTVGRSVATGVENTVTWNDIHHKTNISGGPVNYGYPDADYLKRVQEELAAKGVTEDAI